jgi:hypothetical protein
MNYRLHTDKDSSKYIVQHSHCPFSSLWILGGHLLFLYSTAIPINCSALQLCSLFSFSIYISDCPLCQQFQLTNSLTSSLCQSLFKLSHLASANLVRKLHHQHFSSCLNCLNHFLVIFCVTLWQCLLFFNLWPYVLFSVTSEIYIWVWYVMFPYFLELFSLRF